MGNTLSTQPTKETVLKDDKVLSKIAYKVLSLDDCIQLARMEFGMNEEKLSHIRNGTGNDADKSIAILRALREDMGDKVTVMTLTKHIKELELPENKIHKLDEIMSTYVKEELTWTRGLGTQNVNENETVTFICETNFEASPVWYLGEQLADKTGRCKISQEGLIHTLRLEKVQISDNCIISASVGELTTSAELVVKEEVTWTRGLETQNVNENETVTFICETNFEASPVWYLGEQLADKTGRCKISKEGLIHTLLLKKVQISDNCIVSASVGELTTSADLVVKERTTWKKHLETLKVRENETATFICETSDETCPIWYLGEKRANKMERCTISKEGCIHTLCIQKVQISDEGNVTASIGDLQTSAELSVEDTEVPGKPADVQLLIIGKSGQGKSASGNTILNRNQVFKEESGPRSITSTVQARTGYRHPYRLRVCDTPGLFDSHASMNTIIEKIFQSFDEMPPGPHAILITISANLRYTDGEHAALEKIVEIFGKDVLKYSIICLTHVDGYPVDKYLEFNTNPRFNEILKQVDNRVIGINNINRDSFNVKELLDLVQDIQQKNAGKPFFSVPGYEEAAKKIKAKTASHEEEFLRQKAVINKYIVESSIDDDEKEVLLETCRQLMKLKQNLCSILRDWMTGRKKMVQFIKDYINAVEQKKVPVQKLNADSSAFLGFPCLAGVSGGATTGGAIGATAGHYLGSGKAMGVAVGIGVLVGGVIGGLGGMFTDSTKDESEGLLESAVAVIANHNKESAVGNAVRIGRAKSFRDAIEILFEIDKFQTNALNDEIAHVKTATPATKEELRESIKAKVNHGVFKESSPIDDNFTWQEEFEIVYIDLSNVQNLMVNLKEIHEQLQQGIDHGEMLLTKLLGTDIAYDLRQI